LSFGGSDRSISLEKDFTVILDSYGKFEALWEFSACLVGRRFKILDVAKGETIQKVTFDKIPETSSKICLRVIAKGKPYVTTTEKFIAITLGEHAYGRTLDN
jgi:hypothetical protein